MSVDRTRCKMDALAGYDSDENSAPNVAKISEKTGKNANDGKSSSDLQSEWENFEKMLGGSAFEESGVSGVPPLPVAPPDTSHSHEVVSMEMSDDENNSNKQENADSEKDSSDSSDSDESDKDEDNTSDSDSDDSNDSKNSDKESDSDSSDSDASSHSSLKKKFAKVPSKSRSKSPEATKTLRSPTTAADRRSLERRSSDRRRSRSSRDRSRSRDRRRRSRDRRRSRSSPSRSSRRRRSRDRHRRRRSGSRSRKRRHHSRSPRRRRRSRSKHRRHSRDRKRSRDRHRRGHRRSRSKHRSRSPGRRRRSRSPLLIDKRKENKKLNFKEQLKQSLLSVQKQASEGTLDLTQLDADGRELAQREKPSNLPLNSSNPLAAMATAGEKVTPQMALLQTMAAMHQKAQEITGIAVPKYYNPAAVNPLKYAEQIQKRKLLWSKSTKETTEEVKPYNGLKFQKDSDGKTTEKFRKLMGIRPEEAAGTSHDTDPAATEALRKQEELFRNLDKEYDFARTHTHTQRGMGLGFNTHNVPLTIEELKAQQAQRQNMPSLQQPK